MRTRFNQRHPFLGDPFAELLLRSRTEPGGGGGGGGQGDPPAGDPPAGDPPAGDPPAGDPPKDNFPWDEHNRLKREASERAQAEKQRERDEAQQRGEHEKVIGDLQKENTDIKKENTTLKQEKVVTQVAGRDNIGMLHPEDASRYLSDEEMSDESSAERALTRLKERRPELFKRVKRTGAADIREEEHDDDDDDDDEPETGGEEPMGLERLRGIKRKDT